MVNISSKRAAQIKCDRGDAQWAQSRHHGAWGLFPGVSWRTTWEIRLFPLVTSTVCDMENGWTWGNSGLMTTHLKWWVFHSYVKRLPRRVLAQLACFLSHRMCNFVVTLGDSCWWYRPWSATKALWEWDGSGLLPKAWRYQGHMSAMGVAWDGWRCLHWCWWKTTELEHEAGKMESKHVWFSKLLVGPN